MKLSLDLGSVTTVTVTWLMMDLILHGVFNMPRPPYIISICFFYLALVLTMILHYYNAK